MEEGKEDGFYLVTPSLVRGSGGAQDDPQLFQSGIFFFLFQNYCIYYDDGDSPVHRGPDSVFL